MSKRVHMWQQRIAANVWHMWQLQCSITHSRLPGTSPVASFERCQYMHFHECGCVSLIRNAFQPLCISGTIMCVMHASHTAHTSLCMYRHAYLCPTICPCGLTHTDILAQWQIAGNFIWLRITSVLCWWRKWLFHKELVSGKLVCCG